MAFDQHFRSLSPSTRRAWIEIFCNKHDKQRLSVALHPEGVDRNVRFTAIRGTGSRVALHPEGVDRNQFPPERLLSSPPASPSTRRAWIEIAAACAADTCPGSPSTRRAWIEIRLPCGGDN